MTAAGPLAASGSTAAQGPNVQGEENARPNVDNRGSARQRDSVQPGSEARFNKFGAPEALSDPGAYLASVLPADDVAAARAYLSANRELLGLSESQLAALELVYDAPLGAGSAVLFRQTFGELDAGRDGLVSVGVVDGKVAFLSSSLTTETRLNVNGTRVRAAELQVFEQ
jgi:extracellular elastinolytic metalloproteinase